METVLDLMWKKLRTLTTKKQHDAASNSYIRGDPICTEPKEDAESKGQFFVFANYFKFGAKAIVHSLGLGGRISAVC